MGLFAAIVSTEESPTQSSGVSKRESRLTRDNCPHWTSDVMGVLGAKPDSTAGARLPFCSKLTSSFFPRPSRVNAVSSNFLSTLLTHLGVGISAKCDSIPLTPCTSCEAQSSHLGESLTHVFLTQPLYLPFSVQFRGTWSREYKI